MLCLQLSKPFLSAYGCNIKKLRQKLDAIAKESIMLGFEWTSRSTSDEVVPQPKNTTLVDGVDLCGRDEVVNDLLSNLLGKGDQEERSPHVISLVGMGVLEKRLLPIRYSIAVSCRNILKEKSGFVFPNLSMRLTLQRQ